MLIIKFECSSSFINTSIIFNHLQKITMAKIKKSLDYIKRKDPREVLCLGWNFCIYELQEMEAVQARQNRRWTNRIDFSTSTV